MFDMSKMMGKMKEVQEKMKEAQAQLANIEVEAESGAGMVKAKVNGHKQIVSLEIADELVKPEDKEMMQDLIVAAVNKAIQSAEEKAKEHMQESTSGMLPNIPGLDFNNFT